MRRSLLSVFAVLLVMAVAPRSSALTISATALGSLTPPTAPPGSVIANGDFQITDNGGGSPISGDGWNEDTDWSFDFTSDPGFPGFSLDTVLESATLTLTLFVGGPEPGTDTFELESLGSLSDAAFTTLAQGTTATVDVELLSHYSSSSIISPLLAGAGMLGAGYSDDAIVSFASLELVSVPEPSTILLLATGVAALARRARGMGA